MAVLREAISIDMAEAIVKQTGVGSTRAQEMLDAACDADSYICMEMRLQLEGMPEAGYHPSPPTLTVPRAMLVVLLDELWGIYAGFGLGRSCLDAMRDLERRLF